MGRDVRVDISGDDRKLLQALAKSNAALAKLKREGVSAGRQTAAASGHATSSFGQMAGAIGVATAATSLLSRGLGVVSSALAEVDRRTQQAAQSIRSMHGQTKLLAQVSGSPQELAALRKRTDEVSRKYGMTQEQAGSLMFQAQSRKLMGDVDFLASTHAFADAPGMMTAVADIRGTFGAEEAGTSRQLVNKLLMAAQGSKLSVGEFAPLVGIAGAPAKRIGGSDEMTMAILASLSGKFKSGEMAAQRTSAAAAVFAKYNLGGGKGWGAAIGAFEALPAAQQQKMLTAREEFGSWYEAYKGARGEIGGFYQDIVGGQAASGTAGSPYAKRMKLMGGNIVQLAERAAQEREQVDRPRGGERLAAEGLIDALAAQREAQDRRRPYPLNVVFRTSNAIAEAWGRGFLALGGRPGEAVAAMGDPLVGAATPEEQLRTRLESKEWSRDFTRDPAGTMIRGLEQSMQSLNAAGENLNAAAENLKGASQGNINVHTE